MQQMCFTPAVSLATAVAEFSMSGYILKRKRPLLWPLAAFVFFLGGYQFTEFMLCMVSNPALWARAGFIMYTLLPGLLLHSFLNLSGRKFWYVTYIAPAFFVGYILLQDEFLVRSSCNLLTASVHHLMFHQNQILLALYFAYYAMFPLIGLYAYIQCLRRRTNNELTLTLKFIMATMPLALLGAHIYFLVAVLGKLDPDLVWIQISVLVWMISGSIALLAAIPLVRNSTFFHAILMVTLCSSIATTFILYVIFPQFSYDFPSIYCHFALLYGIASTIIARQKNDHNFPVSTSPFPLSSHKSPKV